MEELNLLIVEDDDRVIDGYNRVIRRYNRIHSRNSGVEINVIAKNNSEDALNIIRAHDNKLDAAIVDLNLTRTGGSEVEGNTIVREIQNRLRFPVYIITSTPHNVDEELKNLESSMFSVKTRGGEEDSGVDEYLKEFVKIYKTGITKLLKAGGTLETYLNNIFWKHLSTSLTPWINNNADSSDAKEKSLLRYTLSHMQEYLDKEVENYSPSEFYITKPVKPHIFTGDIVLIQEEDTNTRYIVLTPSCDIVLRSNGARKAKFILFCKIKSLEEIINSGRPFTEQISSTQRDKIKNHLKNNSQKNYYFIPKSCEIEAGIIDFQDKLTLSSDTVDTEINSGQIDRIATVSTPFLKDIISSYSSYYARQGSPDFNQEMLFSTLFPSNDS